jgi:tetratricopeptide (TPR) repeat protein
LEQGRSEAAVERLEAATRLMTTNAQAWNYLGLAYHHSRQPDKAIEAYRRALKLNNNVVVVHFNLGCALLEQNKLELARDELTTYTFREGKSVAGWIKLGTVQLRLHEIGSAERSFKEALQLSAENPEALNGLGLLEAQRGRQRDAAVMFNRALERQPDYGPALRNLAVVLQNSPNSRPAALQKYRAYLALQPKPADWESVNAAARQLEQEFGSSARPTAMPTVTADSTVVQGRRTAATALRADAPATNPARAEVVTPAPATNVSPPARPATAAVVEITPERVVLPSDPGIKVAESNPRPAAATAIPTTAIAERTPPGVGSDAGPPADPEKRSFLQRINPANIFRSSPRTVGTPAPMTAAASTNGTAGGAGSLSTNYPAVSRTVPVPPRVAGVRYAYLSPAKPAAGNRAEAERLFAQAVRAQNEHRSKDALGLYRAAAVADVSYFEAQANLALAAYNAGDLGVALPAYETALAINPVSFGTRFNFALALRKGGYAQDSAQELERLVAGSAAGEPSEHLAAAHLTLANLYADQFHRPDYARPHYWKVLELDPQNSQASAIRYWLRDNP